MECEHGYETARQCPWCRKILPALPYAGTSGWSGSDTSRERAEKLDRSGETKVRQNKLIDALQEARHAGLTWKEAGDLLGLHHGSVSGVLSVLHEEGFIRRLSERRDKCKVYVLPEFVGHRPTEAHGRKRKPCSHCGFVEEE